MINILRLDHVVLRTENVQKSIEFYCGVLGCSLERQIDNLGLFHLRAGAQLIDLVDVAGELGRLGGAAPGDEAHNMDHFCLRIEPFEAEMLLAHLESHGLAASDVEMRYGAEGHGPSIYISDPDGNTVELKGPAEG